MFTNRAIISWLLVQLVPLAILYFVYTFFSEQNFFNIEGAWKGVVASGPIAAYIFITWMGFRYFKEIITITFRLNEEADNAIGNWNFESTSEHGKSAKGNCEISLQDNRLEISGNFEESNELATIWKSDIAGDPFQIEPIVAVEQWKNENIYTLVGLNKVGAFAIPATEPHDYLVTNLETQYRSIPAIGDIFSRFTYDGILKHNRATGTQRSLKLNGLDVQPLNLIKFPVSKYESIYRAKQLESGTSYQTYSALFTFEFVRWLAEQIQSDPAENFRIGVIAPYRAQANLLSRLVDSWATKRNSVEIQVGTIHGFQGDECDIIIAVLNPPPAISSSPQMFLNKQNILNVAISRARDYLFIIMPNAETEGIQNLRKVSHIEKLVKSSGAFSEYVSHDFEKMIWGNENYLEENTFSTGHQMVNVYRKPERYYEVRSDDSAIDVQIHEKQ
jgi:hypothetical protein